MLLNRRFFVVATATKVAKIVPVFEIYIEEFHIKNSDGNCRISQFRAANFRFFHGKIV
jgi:hypothetical protein